MTNLCLSWTCFKHSLSWTLSPVKSWVLPLCSILIDVWSVFISELTFWLQSSQALCLKSLKFGMRIFYNCTDLVSHISIVLTISDSIFYDTNSCKRKFWKLSSVNNLLILYTESLLLPVNGICGWYYEKKNALFSLFLKAERKSTKLCFLEDSSLLLKKFPLESFLFALIKYLPLLTVQQLGLNLVFLLLHLSLLFNICTCIYACIFTYIKHTLYNMHILYTHISLNFTIRNSDTCRNST